MTAYVTVDEYRAYMAANSQGMTLQTDAAADEFLEGCIAAATEYVERETGRVFLADEDTPRRFMAEAIRWQDPQELRVDFDLLSVSEVKTGSGAVVPSGGYLLLPLNAKRKTIIRLKSAYSWELGNDDVAEVTGRWAYTVEPSADVKRVVCRLAFLETVRRTATGEVVVGEDGYTFQADIPKDLRQWVLSMKPRRPA